MKAIIAVPATFALVYRAWSHKSLTPTGIVVAALTAVAHAVHPWSLPFALLAVFFLAGTRVTKVKKDVKSKLTLHASGDAGGEGPRTHIQVLANSGVSSILTLLHAYQLSRRSTTSPTCFTRSSTDLLVVGIIANYAAVAADTFSSELGILSKTHPRLITSLRLRRVPPGTNGGVTTWGLIAGALGSLIITVTADFLLPYCSTSTSSTAASWPATERIRFVAGILVCGALGSILDSILGGLLQQSVVDTHSGRIVEGTGGKRVLVADGTRGPNSMHFNKRADVKAVLLNGDGRDAAEDSSPDAAVEARLDDQMGLSGDEVARAATQADGAPSRKVESGLALLDNNDVNFLMAATMSVGAMAVASWAWGVPLSSIFDA